MSTQLTAASPLHLGIATEETWGFFNEIYADLTQHYATSLFTRRTWPLPVFHARVNRMLFRHDLQSFLDRNDVTFFEWASGLLAAASRLPKHRGIVTRLHRYELYQWADRINWDAVDKVVVISRGKQAEFVARFPEQAHKVVASRPSIPLSKFTPQPKTFGGDIGTLCQLHPRKRVYDLILAFYELSRQRDGLHLHIGGSHEPAQQDYYDALLYLIAQLGLEEKVTLYGHVADTATWLQQLDVFVSNSYSEGLQVAPMEAMASGCYCLSHAWFGADELLPAANLFVTGGELQAKILRYCDMTEAERQRERAHMRAIACREFDVEDVKVQLRAVLDEVGARYAKVL
ncbi:MAG: glycosyltransferase family 4 protein [Caldilineaceae bacterium]|nr:glycosyltransferase family 4 protein [Caldilineaceae bacterium]